MNQAVVPCLTVKRGQVFMPDWGPRPWGWEPDRGLPAAAGVGGGAKTSKNDGRRKELAPVECGSKLLGLVLAPPPCDRASCDPYEARSEEEKGARFGHLTTYCSRHTGRQ